MGTRYIAILALALSLGGLATRYRAEQATRFREYYEALHQEQPELNALQRVLVSLALTSSRS
jgi:hypothetical protein